MFVSKLFKRNRIFNKIETKQYGRYKNPISRTWSVIKENAFNKKPTACPEHADIVIIGGGYIGSSIAYWLKTRAGEGLSVIVLEKDLTYQGFPRNQSLGILTSHFSLPENIELSKYSADFFRNCNKHLGINIQYNPHGYLILASDKYAENLEQNIAVQKEYGIRNIMLTSEDLKKRYPWLNTTDVKLGCISSESEGTFSSWALLQGLVQKSIDLGAVYVNAEVTGFEMDLRRDMLMEGVPQGTYEKMNRVIYKTPDNEEHSIKFACCVLSAGSQSPYIAELAKIGVGDGLLKVRLPIEERKYNVYSLEDQEKSKLVGLNMPYIMDTSGLWMRKNGLQNNFLCGHIPLQKSDSSDTLEDDFTNIIMPSIHNRLLDWNNLKVERLNTELHDFNIYDESGILGPHSYHNNMYLAMGFGRQGCQHAPGIGRAVSELIIDGQYSSIDMTRLGFDRILMDEPLIERNMY